MIRLALPALVVVALVAAGPANVQDGLIARIGDIDGFGYGPASGFKAANGKPANARDHDVLGDGDFLPDIDRDGRVQTASGDVFDLRGEAELDDTGNTFGAGVVKTSGTTGSKFTDIALSKSYGQRNAAEKVQVRDKTSKRFVSGKGGPFPHPPSIALPIQPGFVFRFEISKAQLAGQTPIYFNIVFGDYDVSPAKIRITRNDGTEKNLSVNTQPKAEDGLIQAATTTLEFDDVFQDGGKMWKGFIKVDFLAPKEPYTAFDYVELSTAPLVQEAQQSGGQKSEIRTLRRQP